MILHSVENSIARLSFGSTNNRTKKYEGLVYLLIVPNKVLLLCKSPALLLRTA
jgi:hypothetical protein